MQTPSLQHHAPGSSSAARDPAPSPSPDGDPAHGRPSNPVGVEQAPLGVRTHRRDEETIEGYVVDVACIRTAPLLELVDRAATHPTACGLMGHCVESGYGLVDGRGGVHLLEPQATPQLVRLLVDTDIEEGLAVRVLRRRDGEEMRTEAVEVISSSVPTVA